jgi:hypothetical protein
MSIDYKKISELELGTPLDNDVIPYVDLVEGKTKKATKEELKGDKGDKGDGATLDAGTTTTGAAGTDASVVNVGSTSEAVFNFTIPRGDKGETGDTGAKVVDVEFSGDNIVFTLDDTSTVTLTDAKIELKGDQGDTGAKIVSGAFVGDDLVFTLDDSSTATVTDAKIDLKGDKGDQGDTGTAATITVDSTETGLPGTDAIVTNEGTTSAAEFKFVIPRGDKGETGDTGDIGIDWQGAWSAGTYEENQAVENNGSSWIATTTTTQEPSGTATDWDLIARKGEDGEGSGDMMAATYDPTEVEGDAFNMDNMAQGTNNKYLSDAELTVVQNTSGTNTGDQTSIVGITGTTAEFNTALTDGSFATGGGTATGTNTGDQDWGDIGGTLSDQTDLQTALDGKEPTITEGTTSEYYRGDKTFQTLDKDAVGLGNVDNTSDATKNTAEATLTNKTITDTTNNVTANGLRTATGTVSVSSATAPTAGQVLTATNGTTATWQDGGGGDSSWELIDTWTHSTDVDEVIFTDLEDYSALLVVSSGLTLASSSSVRAVVSEDNGSTFLTTGQYSTRTGFFSSDFLQATATTDNPFIMQRYLAWNNSTPRMVNGTCSSDAAQTQFIKSENVLDAIKIYSGTNFTGGTIKIYGKS